LRHSVPNPRQHRARAFQRVTALRRSDEFTAKILLFVCATAVGLVVIELALRLIYPISMMNVEVQRTGEAGADLLLPDEILGIRPALGTDLYDTNAILYGRSIVSNAQGPSKILFIGDSVTAYGRIVNALADLAGSGTMSFLNGGVAGYNIQQEIELFFRYQSSLKPEVIVHQMHINDLQASRLVLRDRSGTVKIYSPRLKPVDVNQTLYRYSQLYRFILANFRSRASKEELQTAASDALRRMRDYTRANGIAYHLVLFPILEPLASWTAYDKDTRDYLLRITRELGLDTVDLSAVSDRMIAEGVDPRSAPGDSWHPNQPMADAAAKYIVQRIPSLFGPMSK
jgi:hypothetical protein